MGTDDTLSVSLNYTKNLPTNGILLPYFIPTTTATRASSPTANPFFTVDSPLPCQYENENESERHGAYGQKPLWKPRPALDVGDSGRGRRGLLAHHFCPGRRSQLVAGNLMCSHGLSDISRLVYGSFPGTDLAPRAYCHVPIPHRVECYDTTRRCQAKCRDFRHYFQRDFQQILPGIAAGLARHLTPEPLHGRQPFDFQTAGRQRPGL